MQARSPNYTHTYSRNMPTPLSKRSPNTPFYTPFPSHISHLHPDKYSPNRTTAITSSPPPNTLKTGKNKVVKSGGRGRSLTNTQWHAMTFLPLNRLCHLYPPHPSLSLTGHPVQRYAAANEAQSGWTTATQTTQKWGGEWQHFCVKNKRSWHNCSGFLDITLIHIGFFAHWPS